MNRKTFEIISYSAIGVVAVMLVLMLMNIIPRGANIYVLFFAVIILILRIFFRIIFFVKDRRVNRR